MSTNYYQIGNTNQQEQINFVLNQNILQYEQKKYNKYNTRMNNKLNTMQQNTKQGLTKTPQKLNTLLQPQQKSQQNQQQQQQSQQQDNQYQLLLQYQQEKQQQDSKPNLLRYQYQNKHHTKQSINEDNDPFSKIQSLNAAIKLQQQQQQQNNNNTDTSNNSKDRPFFIKQSQQQHKRSQSAHLNKPRIKQIVQQQQNIQQLQQKNHSNKPQKKQLQFQQQKQSGQAQAQRKKQSRSQSLQNSQARLYNRYSTNQPQNYSFYSLKKDMKNMEKYAQYDIDNRVKQYETNNTEQQDQQDLFYNNNNYQNALNKVFEQMALERKEKIQHEFEEHAHRLKQEQKQMLMHKNQHNNSSKNCAPYPQHLQYQPNQNNILQQQHQLQQQQQQLLLQQQQQQQQQSSNQNLTCPINQKFQYFGPEFTKIQRKQQQEYRQAILKSTYKVHTKKDLDQQKKYTYQAMYTQRQKFLQKIDYIKDPQQIKRMENNFTTENKVLKAYHPLNPQQQENLQQLSNEIHQKSQERLQIQSQQSSRSKVQSQQSSRSKIQSQQTQRSSQQSKQPSRPNSSQKNTVINNDKKSKEQKEEQPNNNKKKQEPKKEQEPEKYTPEKSNISLKYDQILQKSQNLEKQGDLEQKTSQKITLYKQAVLNYIQNSLPCLHLSTLYFKIAELIYNNNQAPTKTESIEFFLKGIQLARLYLPQNDDQLLKYKLSVALLILQEKVKKYYNKASDFLYENLQLQKHSNKPLQDLIFSYKEAILTTNQLNLKQKSKILAQQALIISKNKIDSEKFIEDPQILENIQTAQQQFQSYIENTDDKDQQKPYQITSSKLQNKWLQTLQQVKIMSQELAYLKNQILKNLQKNDPSLDHQETLLSYYNDYLDIYHENNTISYEYMKILIQKYILENNIYQKKLSLHQKESSQQIQQENQKESLTQSQFMQKKFTHQQNLKNTYIKSTYQNIFGPLFNLTQSQLSYILEVSIYENIYLDDLDLDLQQPGEDRQSVCTFQVTTTKSQGSLIQQIQKISNSLLEQIIE